MFYTITNLQGSQTVYLIFVYFDLFYTITNLQGSQTIISGCIPQLLFYTITNLQGSQTSISNGNGNPGFTPLQTYKVLKRS